MSHIYLPTISMPPLETLSDIMQIITGIVAIIIAFLVFHNSKKKDQEDIREKNWNAQQQLNIAALGDDRIHKAHDLLFSGDFENSSDDICEKNIFITFVILNRVQLIWHGYNSKIFTEDEMHAETTPTIALIIRNLEILDYCLTRGYSKDFAAFIKSRISASRAYRNEIESTSQFLYKLRNKDKN